LERARIGRALDRTIVRIDRRIDALRSDLERIERAAATARHATAFIAEAARAPRGARSLEVVDWSTGEPRTIVLPLDPARTAREQLDAIFHRARRMKHGAIIANARLADADKAKSALAGARAEVATASLEALQTLEAAARRTAPRDYAAGARAVAERPG